MRSQGQHLGQVGPRHVRDRRFVRLHDPEVIDDDPGQERYRPAVATRAQVVSLGMCLKALQRWRAYFFASQLYLVWQQTCEQVLAHSVPHDAPC